MKLGCVDVCTSRLPNHHFKRANRTPHTALPLPRPKKKTHTIYADEYVPHSCSLYSLRFIVTVIVSSNVACPSNCNMHSRNTSGPPRPAALHTIIGPYEKDKQSSNSAQINLLHSQFSTRLDSPCDRSTGHWVRTT